MVERYPKGAKKVFAALFNRPNWNNERDFPALMKKHKSLFLKAKVRPTVIQTVEVALEERLKKRESNQDSV
jgi:mannose/fructose/N-acetylgalactosamine-specific phosphotransferase system component IID